MLRHSLAREVLFSSLLHIIAPALDLMPCLQAKGTRDCNKGIKFKEGAINCYFITILLWLGHLSYGGPLV